MVIFLIFIYFFPSGVWARTDSDCRRQAEKNRSLYPLLRDATKWSSLDHITEDKQHFFLMVLDSESKSFLQCSPAEQSQILLSLYFQRIKSRLHKNPLAFFNSYIPWWSQGNMSPCFWWAPAFCWTTAPKSPCRLSFWEELKLEWCQPEELPWWQHR